MQNPSNTGKRAEWADFIRGVSLLGILVMTLQTYTLFTFLKPGQVYEMQLDKPETYVPVQFFIHLFVTGQFDTLYSFVLGLSFYTMWEENSRLGLNAGRIFRRHMWILLLIGLVHAFVFWYGDVIHKYALLGFTLPFFNKKSISSILKWIIAMACFVIVFQVAKTVVFLPSHEFAAEFHKVSVLLNVRVGRSWQHGSITKIAGLRWSALGTSWLESFESGFASIVHYEIMCLLGIITGKLNIFNRPTKFRLLLVRVGMWLFPVAILLKAICSLPITGVALSSGRIAQYESLLFSVGEFITIPLVTIVYLIELRLLFGERPGKVQTWIANAGRMSLTNYLMQTLICMVLFFEYAVGLSGKLTLLESVIISLLIYIGQLIYSTVWFQYYNFGPLEGYLRRWNCVARDSPKPEKVQQVSDLNGY